MPLLRPKDAPVTPERLAELYPTLSPETREELRAMIRSGRERGYSEEELALAGLLTLALDAEERGS